MSAKQVAKLSDDELANQPQEWKNEKLLDACWAGDLTAVKRLVAAKADVDYTYRYDEDPLEMAVWNDHLPIVEYLLTHGAKVKERHLEAAVEECEVDVVHALINAGAKVTEEHLVTAVECRTLDIVQILINAGAKVTNLMPNIFLEKPPIRKSRRAEKETERKPIVSSVITEMKLS